ncbi:hypothetical protein MTBUT4_250066 [Magnetospirillum sp. UT-4]|nr:hypothetical protein MTBUT4_250066 [Magnetospirillum sp. UT-4]
MRLPGPCRPRRQAGRPAPARPLQLLSSNDGSWVPPKRLVLHWSAGTGAPGRRRGDPGPARWLIPNKNRATRPIGPLCGVLAVATPGNCRKLCRIWAAFGGAALELGIGGPAGSDRTAVISSPHGGFHEAQSGVRPRPATGLRQRRQVRHLRPRQGGRPGGAAVAVPRWRRR